MRQVRESAECDGAEESGVQSGRTESPGGEPIHEASFPESAEAGVAAPRVGERDVGEERVVLECDQHHEWMDRQWPQAPLHHSRPEVGHSGADGGVRGQGVLRVVRRSDRVHQHHRQLHEGVASVVAEPRAGASGAVHGEGQHPLPHGDLPVHPDGHARPLDARQPGELHGVPELRGREVQQEPGHGCVRRPGEGDGHSLGGVAILPAGEPA